MGAEPMKWVDDVCCIEGVAPSISHLESGDVVLATLTNYDEDGDGGSWLLTAPMAGEPSLWLDVPGLKAAKLAAIRTLGCKLRDRIAQDTQLLEQLNATTNS